MTVRLTIAYVGDPERLIVTEFENHTSAYATLTSPDTLTADLVVIQELQPPVESTWGKVNTGDEVVAPDGSLWRVDVDLHSASIEGVPVADHVWLTSLDGQRNINFPVTPDMPIMRRPGVLSAAAQLLHDVGLWSGR